MLDESEKIVKPHVISVDLFSRRNNKTTQLIENISDEKALDGRNRWYKFELETPVYVRQIEIDARGYNNWDEVEFEVDHIDGTRHQERVKFSSDSVSLSLGKLISAFRFRPDSKWLSDPKIGKVSVTGLTLDEFHAYEWALKDFDKREADILQRESIAEALREEVSELRGEKSSLNDEIGQAKAQLLKLEQSVTLEEQALDEGASKRADLNQEIDSMRTKRRELIEDIEIGFAELQSLKKEVGLFPSEIAGFVKEGNRNIRWYVAISVPFVAIICVVLWALFSSAIDLTQLWRREQDVDVWTVFLTRIPFVVVAITILEVCGYVVGRLVFEIIKINRQRLSLSKLSIIAKDVTTASAHKTDMNDEEIFQRETELKMELLKDHMKEYVSEEFSYKGTFLQSIASSAAQKLVGGEKA